MSSVRFDHLAFPRINLLDFSTIDKKEKFTRIAAIALASIAFVAAAFGLAFTSGLIMVPVAVSICFAATFAGSLIATIVAIVINNIFKNKIINNTKSKISLINRSVEEQNNQQERLARRQEEITAREELLARGEQQARRDRALVRDFEAAQRLSQERLQTEKGWLISQVKGLRKLAEILDLGIKEKPDGIKINIIVGQGKNIDLSVDPSSTVFSLKRLIQNKTGIPWTLRKLTLRAKVMEDAKKLSDYGVQNNNWLNYISPIRFKIKIR